MQRALQFGLVCGGSALGGGLRYAVALWAASRGWTAFPWATLIVNVVGCFLITLIVTIAAATAMSLELRLFLTTGVMGGLTTYSSFDYETTRLFQDGAPGKALLNVGVTVVVCFLAGLAGIALARAITGK